MRRLAWLLPCLLALMVAAPVRAQAPASQISATQAQQALDVLKDPAKLAAMIATLDAIIKAQPAVGPATISTAKPGGEAAAATPTAPPAKTPIAASTTATASPLGLPLAPDSVGAAVLVSAAAFLNSASDRVTEGFRAAQGLPLLWSWLVTMATDPIGHMLIEDLAWRMAVVLALSFTAFYATMWLLRRPLRVVARRLIRLHPPMVRTEPEESGEARAEGGETEPPRRRLIELGRLLRRVPLVLGRLALLLVPVLAFLVVGHVVVGSELGGTDLTRLVLLAVVDSIGLCAAVLRLVRSVLAPRHRRLRLVPVPDETAIYAHDLDPPAAGGGRGWLRRRRGRAAARPVPGRASRAAEGGGAGRCTSSSRSSWWRSAVWCEAGSGAGGRERICWRACVTASPRSGIGSHCSIWSSLWLVWAAALPAGYEHLTRVLVAIVVVALLARVATSAGLGVLERLKGRAPKLADRYPGIDVRLALYLRSWSASFA